METTTIEKQLEKVSPIVKRVFFSVEVAEEIAKIGEKNGLLLDKIDDLIEETGFMIIGLKSSKDFVSNLSNKLKIETAIARKIAIQINDEVLKDIREEIQKLENNTEQPEFITQTPTILPPPNLPTDSTLSSLEQAGNFTIENTEPVSSSPQYKENNLSREEVLQGIENPPQAVATPMIDHLLGNPVNSSEKIEVKKAPEAPIQKKQYTNDPYREQI